MLPVGPKLQLLEDVLQRDETPNIEGDRVVKLLCGRICSRAMMVMNFFKKQTTRLASVQALTEVHYVHGAAHDVAVLAKAVAVRRLHEHKELFRPRSFCQAVSCGFTVT